MTPIAFRKPVVQKKLTSVKHAVEGLLRWPNLTLEDLDAIANQMTALAEQATALVRRRKGKAGPTDRL